MTRTNPPLLLRSWEHKRAPVTAVEVSRSAIGLAGVGAAVRVKDGRLQRCQPLHASPNMSPQPAAAETNRPQNSTEEWTCACACLYQGGKWCVCACVRALYQL